LHLRHAQNRKPLELKNPGCCYLHGYNRVCPGGLSFDEVLCIVLLPLRMLEQNFCSSTIWSPEPDGYQPGPADGIRRPGTERKAALTSVRGQVNNGVSLCQFALCPANWCCWRLPSSLISSRKTTCALSLMHPTPSRGLVLVSEQVTTWRCWGWNHVPCRSD
jgi:hypothetical protein